MTGTQQSENHVVHFVGIVHPQSGSWYFDGPIELTRDGAAVTITIMNSTFRASVRTQAIADLDSLWNQTASDVRTALDSLSYLRAAPINIELVGGTMDDRAHIGIALAWDALAANAEGHFDGSTTGPVLKAAYADAQVRHALADLRMALEYVDDTGFYCYRAIESIRQCYIAEGQGDEGSARRMSWSRMRDELSIERSEIDVVTDLAKPRRHGQHSAISSDERFEALALARRIVRAYIDKTA